LFELISEQAFWFWEFYRHWELATAIWQRWWWTGNQIYAKRGLTCVQQKSRNVSFAAGYGCSWYRSRGAHRRIPVRVSSNLIRCYRNEPRNNVIWHLEQVKPDK